MADRNESIVNATIPSLDNRTGKIMRENRRLNRFCEIVYDPFDIEYGTIQEKKHGLISSTKGVVERYVNHGLHVLCKFYWPRYGSDYFAVFHSNTILKGDDSAIVGLIYDWLFSSGDGVREEADSIGRNIFKNDHPGRESRDNHFVFVVDVEFVENAKEAITSLVWLLPCDDFNSGTSSGIYGATHSGLEILGVDFAEDGKAVFLFDIVAVMLYERANRMIESRPEIMNGVPKDEGKFVRDLLLNHEDEIDVPVTIVFGDNSVRFRVLEEGHAQGIEVSEVLFGPLDLSPRAGKWVTHYNEVDMSDDKKQKTPKGHEIPVPKRASFSRT